MYSLSLFVFYKLVPEAYDCRTLLDMLVDIPQDFIFPCLACFSLPLVSHWCFRVFLFKNIMWPLNPSWEVGQQCIKLNKSIFLLSLNVHSHLLVSSLRTILRRSAMIRVSKLGYRFSSIGPEMGLVISLNHLNIMMLEKTSNVQWIFELKGQIIYYDSSKFPIAVS